MKELTAQVMVRTRRASVALALELPARLPAHPEIDLTRKEAALYSDTATFLRDLYREGFVEQSDEEVAVDRKRRKRRTGKGILQLELVRLSQRLCSSAAALAHSLEGLSEADLITPAYRRRAKALAAAAKRVTSHAKLDALEEIIGRVADKIIVFSEHLPTLDLIAKRVRKLGRTAVVYSGSLSMAERAKRLAQFKAEPKAVFVATRAGTEGLNLQFCNVLVNYELPWNPMVVEQRIGRIHRIGQTREAHIINFAARGTIEAHVLRLLDQKIKLFELVVGELDVILGDFGGAEKLEERLADAWLSAESDDAFEERIETIGNEIVSSREVGLKQEQLNSEVAAEDNAGQLERDFQQLSIPDRLRLGYGTNHLRLAPGIDAKRHQIGLHVGEILEALENTAPIEDAGVDPDHGPLTCVTGVTGAGRGVRLTVHADQLPMTVVDLSADVETPLATRRRSPVPKRRAS